MTTPLILTNRELDESAASKAGKNSYINGIKSLAEQYKIKPLEVLTQRGLSHVQKDTKNSKVSLRKLKNRESAKNSRRRRKLYIELMERKVRLPYESLDQGPGGRDQKIERPTRGQQLQEEFQRAFGDYEPKREEFDPPEYSVGDQSQAKC